MVHVCVFLAGCAVTHTGEYPEYPGASTEPPREPAVPKEVRTESSIVDLAAGLVWVELAPQDRDVQVGDVLQLRRGGDYVGQMDVMQREDDLAGGVFDRKFHGPGAPPRIGDIAHRATGVLECGTGEHREASTANPPTDRNDG